MSRLDVGGPSLDVPRPRRPELARDRSLEVLREPCAARPAPAHGFDSFGLLLERLRCEHEREVGELRGQLSQFSTEQCCREELLDGARQPTAESDPQARDLPTRDAFPAAQRELSQHMDHGSVGPKCPSGGLLCYGGVPPVKEVYGTTSGDAREFAGVQDMGMATSLPSEHTIDDRQNPTSSPTVKSSKSSSVWAAWAGIRNSRQKSFLSHHKNNLRLMAMDRRPSYSTFLPIKQVERMVDSAWFEAVVLVAIGLNIVIMAIEIQFQGFDLGAKLGYEHGILFSSPSWANSSSDSIFNACEWIFGVLFAIEVFLRLVGQRFKFIRDPWGVMDVLILAMWPVSALEGRVVAINPTIIRMARLVRLARVLRPLKKIRKLDSLVLILTSLRSSFSILAWTMCLLFIVLVFDALMLNQVLVEFYFQDETYPLAERQEVYRHFGSFTTSLFSMFELTLANWPPICRLLYESVSQWFIFIAIVHKVTLGFALVGVINGVFMQETFRVAQQDDILMLRQGRNANTVHAQRMKRLMEVADKNTDARIDRNEWRAIFRNPELKLWLASMDFASRDVDALFTMMDKGKGGLTIDELIDGVANLRGPARNIDVQHLLMEHQELRDVIEGRTRPQP